MKIRMTQECRTDHRFIPTERESRCKACGATIKWVETRTGKKMPLDAKPFKAVEVREGIGQVIDVYMPHFATCPGAEQFRRARRDS